MTQQHQVSYREISDLIPYINNARTHSDEQINQIASSIKEFGFTNPVLVDGENGIIAGHGRVMAAKKLNIQEVPTIELSHLSDTQKKAYILADNKLALNAGWDGQILSLELLGLQEADFDLDLIGFSQEEVDEILSPDIEKCEGKTDPDEVPEVTEEPKTKLGDVWILGKHRLMCGDSTNIDALERLMDGRKADVVFTDPPYGVSIVNIKKDKEVGGGSAVKFGKVGGGGVVDAKEYAEIIGDDTTDTARDFYNSCIAVGIDRFIIWGGNYFTDFLPPSPCWLVWDKQNSGNFADVELAWCSDGTAAKLYRFTWNGMSRQGDRKTELSTRVHPTQKPVGMFEEIFKDFKFTLCLDGFLGSGSSLIACEKTNRICYGMEMSAQYCDVIINRWQNFTGNDAVLESTGQSYNEM
jgi:DNA modification methylase